MKIALISEHASPLAQAGGIDDGGQNIYVANVAAQLAKLGHSVDVYTRRSSRQQADVVQSSAGVRVFHLRAGPQHVIPKEELLPHMPQFSAELIRCYERERRTGEPYDVSHANFFM